MVARVVTIKAAGDRVGAVLDYYAGLAADQLQHGGGPGRGPVEYYLDPNEPPGRWWGAGLPALGLPSGAPVLPEQLRALLEGCHPANRRRLGRGYGDRSAPEFDATFSAPKSVSVLWALTEDPWVRAAQDAAVDAALAWVQRHGLVTRRGYRGVDQVDAQGLAAGVFRQHTSRTADPQLHTHAVISSKVQDGTGMWLALDARWLKTQQRSLSWVYDAAPRSELAGRVGLDWEPVPDGSGQADLVGVPEALTEVFSKRSRQVENKLAELIARWSDEHDGAEPGPRDLYLLERRAVTSSRPGKDHAVDAAVLRTDWQAQARAAGHRPDRLSGGQSQLPGADPIDAQAVIGTALEEVRRFTHHWEADASLALRAGDPQVAVAYAEAGRLRTAHPATIADQVARQHDRLVARGHTVAITTASAGTARDINVEIQHRGNPTFSGPNVTLADDTVAFAGDRIATRRNDPTLLTNSGGEVRNRHTWTVICVHRNGDLTVTDPDRGSVRLPAGYVARHVELGWATTGWAIKASPSTPASPSSNPPPPEPASTSP